MLSSVTAKRPATVIKHLLEYGCITSQELEEKYGCKHPPRAIRDVREQGIPIETYNVKDTNGKTIAAYRFGDPANAETSLKKSAGRTVLSKALKKVLIDQYGAKCFVYLESMDEKELQIDHRIPYEINGEGDSDFNNVESFMLLSPSANRAKSWTCEHCPNWVAKDKVFCISCFWAYPEKYDHIAGRKEKIINIIFTGDEILDYEKLIALSGIENAQKTIKDLLNKYLNIED